MSIYRNVVLTLLLIAAVIVAIELKPRPAITPAEPALSPEAEQILDRRIPSLVLHHGTIRQAIDIIHEATGVKLSVDWKAIPKWDALAIDVELHDVPLGEAVAYLFQMDRVFYDSPEQVDFDVVNQTVWITRSDLFPPAYMTFRIYDVHDLLTDEYWGCPSGADPQETQIRRLDALANMLEATGGSRNWVERRQFGTHGPGEQTGNGDLQIHAGRLIIFQTTRGQRQIQAALQRLRNGGVPPEPRKTP